jgi:LemA protein
MQDKGTVLEEELKPKNMMGCIIFTLVGVLIASLMVGCSAFGVYKSTWNDLNTKYQLVESRRSGYSAALNICSQKAEGVWTLADQYMNHESKTFTEVAKARSGMLSAAQQFKQLQGSGATDVQLQQQAAAFNDSLRSFMINIQVEKYPDLKAAETTKQAMRALEEATNEIKTSLDDWIFSIREYNTYRGSFWPNILGSIMPKFPDKIDYYEGKIKELDINSLNPQNQVK